MVAKERTILANFQTLNNMVIDTGHYDINPQLPLGKSTIKTTEVEGNHRKTRSLFELIIGTSTASVAKKVILAPRKK